MLPSCARLFERDATRTAAPARAACAIGSTSSPASARAARSPGRVSLVGAGPGDPELLTLKALRVLSCADVVLFDDLVSPAILALSRATARRLHVGKRGYRPSCRQESIHRLMIRYASRGLHVVRLKSGDPLVFARAAEEIAALRAAGIAIDIVPGITSALALGAATQCALTARGQAQALEMLTAHDRSGELPAVFALASSADPARTLIVYMGATKATAIVESLLTAGRAATTPVVAVAGLSRPDQRMWCGELAHLVAGVASLPQELPIVLGIGSVFGALLVARRVDPGVRESLIQSSAR